MHRKRFVCFEAAKKNGRAPQTPTTRKIGNEVNCNKSFHVIPSRVVKRSERSIERIRTYLIGVIIFFICKI